MKIYLAGAFFNIEERTTISFLADKLRKQGHDVYVPMEHAIPNAWDLTNQAWGKAVFEEDVVAIKACDIMLAVYNGMNSDTGTVWEIGFAYGIEKPVITVHKYDTRTVASIMVWNGCTLNIDMATLDNPNWPYMVNDTVAIEQK